MSDFLNTRIFTDKLLVDKLTSFDVPIISEDNAILHHLRKDDYLKNFNLSEIQSGVHLYNGTYYFSLHNIINTPKRNIGIRYGNLCFSYNVYPITDDFYEKIKNNNVYSHWEVIFNSMFYFQRTYHISGIIKPDLQNHIFLKLESLSYLKEEGLYIPYNHSPSDLLFNKSISGSSYPRKNGDVTIGEYLNCCKPTRDLQKNTSVYRNMLMESIF